MIYTISANPLYLPKNVWLCQAYIPEGTNPKFTAYSPATNKWGAGNENQVKGKFTLDAPPFPVYTTESFLGQVVLPDNIYIDLDTTRIYHGSNEIAWVEFREYLSDYGIKLSITQLAEFFKAPELLKDRVYDWNATIKNTVLSVEDVFSTPLTANELPAMEPIYEQMKAQLFKGKTFIDAPVKRSSINPYKWVLSGGKVTYTPTEQVVPNGKPEF